MDTNWLQRTVSHLRNLGSKQRRRLRNARRGQRRRLFVGFEMLEDRQLLAASLSINDPLVVEGDVGSVNLDFTVTRGGDDLLSSVTVAYHTSDNSPALGAATAGSDYTAASGIVTIPSGSTTATISVPVLGDTTVEANEQLFVNLTGITKVTGPDANFSPEQAFATGVLPFGVSVGDLNGDGRPDLAVANFYSNTVSVLFNSTAAGAAAPSFAAKQDFATGGGSYSVTVGDLNGDGRPDLAVVNAASATVSVLL
ncbi:MAG: FG-GAP-like repeat-containing protein, partial [Planctomycetota bacterium]|nr:FG-GAP-like repeat-containing protein [Planctomycetota bacterium]